MTAPTLRIYEIYDSIQGESTLAGMPCTLIRLAGCPLRCHYCDTPQSIPTDSGHAVALDELVADVAARGRPLVLVTGGEPLAQRNTIPLLERLVALGVIVQVETAGAYPMNRVPEGVHRVVDFKAPGSGELARNCLDNLQWLRPGDEIKLVLADRADYEWAREFIREHKLGGDEVPVLLSPVWGSVEPSQLCEWLLEDRLPVWMQMQMHKVIWGAEANGV